MTVLPEKWQLSKSRGKFRGQLVISSFLGEFLSCKQQNAIIFRKEKNGKVVTAFCNISEKARDYL
jgi:hypothetical protein